MTGYVVHYRYGATNMSQSVPPSYTHVEILDLTECYNYIFYVEATSEHLSGISDIVIFELRRHLNACRVHTLNLFFSVQQNYQYMSLGKQ